MRRICIYCGYPDRGRERLPELRELQPMNPESKVLDDIDELVDWQLGASPDQLPNELVKRLYAAAGEVNRKLREQHGEDVFRIKLVIESVIR